MDISDYLIDQGWQPNDVSKMVEAYGEQDYIFGAVKTIEWMDDDEHHYTDELIQHIVEWERIESIDATH